MRVLVTGATGYIGGRLVPRLLARGHAVRVLVRDPMRIAGRPWHRDVEVATADLLDREGLAAALEGVDAAYYLVHSMTSGRDFEERDRIAARNFVAAARSLRRVVYMGGLLPKERRVSAHLESRGEVGRILREGTSALELRAGPIIGSGSASFEMVRYLTERLPAMVAPRWIVNDVQPVSVRDALASLLLSLERDATGVVEIGADRLTFRRMMEVYAEVRGLRRIIVPVPVLAPRLAARWVGLITPIPNAIAVPIVEGVIHPVLADTSRARELFPEIEPRPYRRAVEDALEKTLAGDVETRWSGALGTASTYELTDREGLIREVRTARVDVPEERVFEVFSSLGGERGWLVWNWAWRLRGAIDRIVGGPGLRRGRRDAARVLPGEALDFWRVEAVSAPRMLRLRAEMKVPGRAWLQWEAIPENGTTRLVQTAIFAPVGLPGTLYWYGLYPFHRKIFNDLAKAVAREARRSDGGASRPERPPR